VTRSFSLHLRLDSRRIVARNETKREYNASRFNFRPRITDIRFDFFDRPRFSFGGNGAATTDSESQTIKNLSSIPNDSS